SAPGAQEQAGGGFGWTLAPIRWGGDIGLQFRSQTFGGQTRRLQRVEFANLKAASYLWQPWFAQIAGGVGVVRSSERGGGDSGTTSIVSPTSNSSTLVGNATLALLPISRFPFNAYFDRTDSRATSETARNDFTNTRYGLRQHYRPADGMSDYTASYDRSTLDSPSFERDRVEALAAGMKRRSGAQALEVVGSQTRSDRSSTGEGSVLNRMVSHHSYRPGPDLSVESLASASGNNFRLRSGGALSDSRSRFLQLNTFTNWRPSDNTPLYLTGGGRLFQSASELDGARTESQSLGGDVAAQYRLNRNASLIGSASVTRVSTDGSTDVLASESAGTSYASDATLMGPFLYQWNGSLNLTNRTGGQEGTRQNAAGQFGHNLTRNLPLSETSTLNLNLGQTYGRNYDTVTASSQTVTHSASTSWRVVPDASTIGYVSLLGSDSRTSGYNESEFQLINFQASGQFQFDRNSVGSANLTMQGTRQGTPGTPPAGFNRVSSGNINYQHLRAFGVRQLRYFAKYAVNDSQFKSRLLGDLDAPREQVTQSLEQRLEYFIGRVELRLTVREERIERERERLLFFSIVRRLGDI
ncbi:MAG: hypothetical protein WBO23_17310, partial [Burkholderiales bacterium]